MFDVGGKKRRRKAIVIQDYTKQLIISPRKREKEKRKLLRLFVCITGCPPGTGKAKRMGQDDGGAIRDWEKGAGALSFRRFSF